MIIEKIRIQRIGSSIYELNALIYNHNNFYRYMLIPYAVENPKEPRNNLNAVFIVQKKAKNEQWEDLDTLQINKLKVGEWAKIELPSAAVSIMVEYFNKLKTEILDRPPGYLDFSEIILIVDNLENGKFSGNNAQSLSSLLNKINENKLDVESIIRFLEDNMTLFEKITDSLEIDTVNELYNALKTKNY